MRCALLVLAVTFAPLAAAAERCIAVDGDTLVCNHKKVRLTNVYAPELNEPGGHAAKRRLNAIVKSGNVVLRSHGQDRYGRMLAEVYVNGRRVEQTDVGPRGGRGAKAGADRHVFVWTRSPPKPSAGQQSRRP
ncbi:MAG TPA: thermonuclease family protein [Burkholderiales bacterium]|nr:thermonuclease family protein [Burkholderiales bacterium]